ncbi:MAG: NfeD family protein [Bacteroidales bacterium]|nr:NfeD family protein [Bacteroidales bacterium]MCF8404102.1 NfeD family protein [Bacteroidales bacterium]
METWHILITIGIIAFIFEIFTAGFISASIGIGLLFTATGNYFGLEIKWQILLFAFGVAITFFLIRPIITKYGYSKNMTKTNKDALIDKIGKVTQEINTEKDTGRVSIDGDDWKAVSKNNDIIEVGRNVRIIDIDSIILFVEPLN